MLELKTVKIDPPKDCNVVLGMAHFIKTIEDLYEALVNAVPNIKFGIGFCESSGPCLVRHEGNDDELRHSAAEKPSADRGAAAVNSRDPRGGRAFCDCAAHTGGGRRPGQSRPTGAALPRHHPGTQRRDQCAGSFGDRAAVRATLSPPGGAS